MQPNATTTTYADESRIIAEISQIVTEVIGADYLTDTEISASTTFAGDLQIESIEFVSLAARLQGKYGSDVDFVAFMADLGLGEIEDLTVGRVAAYIARSLDRTAQRSPGGSHDA